MIIEGLAEKLREHTIRCQGVEDKVIAQRRSQNEYTVRLLELSTIITTLGWVGITVGGFLIEGSFRDKLLRGSAGIIGGAINFYAHCYASESAFREAKLNGIVLATRSDKPSQAPYKIEGRMAKKDLVL